MSNVKCEDVKCLLRDRIDDDLAYAMLCLNIVKEIINVHFVFHGCVGWYYITSLSLQSMMVTRCYDGGDCNQGMFVICWLLDCSAGWTVTDRLDVSCAAKYDFTGRRHINHLFDVWTFTDKIKRLPSLQLVRNLLKDPVSLILALK